MSRDPRKLDRIAFVRSVRTVLADQFVPGMDDSTLKELFVICGDCLCVYDFGQRAKSAAFGAKLRDRKRRFAHLQCLTTDLQNELGHVALSGELNSGFQGSAELAKLAEALEDAEFRLRAIESMAGTAGRESYPGTLSASLNDFLAVHHRKRWNQRERDMIIAACLLACRVYSGKDTFADIVARIPMHRSRAARIFASAGGRFVHRPGDEAVLTVDTGSLT